MLQPDVTPTTPAEVEEEEPRLKYQRLGASVSDILEKDPASCLCVSDKILALGTHDGTLHILDIHGNEVTWSHKLRCYLHRLVRRTRCTSHTAGLADADAWALCR